MKTAIVGCGAIAQVHAACIRELQQNSIKQEESKEACRENPCAIEIVGFADCKLDRAEKMASTYGGRPYRSLEEMLEQEEIDVLHICTPHYLHVPMAIQALTKHVNVFSEKPPVISYEQLAQLKAVQTEKQLGFCFQNRYNHSIIKVKEMIAAGETGKILGARGIVTWMRDRAYYEESDWRGRLATEGGGVLINQSIHTMDLLQYLIDEEPVSIHAVTTNHHLQGIMEEEDTMSAMLQYPDTRAVFYATSAYTSNPEPLIELECEKMRIRIEGENLTCYLPDGSVEYPKIATQQKHGKSYWGAGHRDCIAAFYHSIWHHQVCPLNLTEVEPTLRLMLGAYESARTAATVMLHT